MMYSTRDAITTLLPAANTDDPDKLMSAVGTRAGPRARSGLAASHVVANVAGAMKISSDARPTLATPGAATLAAKRLDSVANPNQSSSTAPGDWPGRNRASAMQTTGWSVSPSGRSRRRHVGQPCVGGQQTGVRYRRGSDGAQMRPWQMRHPKRWRADGSGGGHLRAAPRCRERQCERCSRPRWEAELHEAAGPARPERRQPPLSLAHWRGAAPR
jgi:hypothetical protein